MDVSDTIVNAVRKVLPSSVKSTLRYAMNEVGEWSTALYLARLRHRMFSIPCGANKTEQLLHYNVRINNGRIFYFLYKDIFLNRLYHFEAQRPDPFILDCGSHIGISILYYKHVYKQARIIGFEPDPALFPYLQENIDRNGLTDVQLVQAALSGQEKTLTFYSDGLIGSCLAKNMQKDTPPGQTKYEVPCVRLREYLTESVDFLKMNIEGAEWEVLADSEDRLRNIREMVIEYHHLPGLPRTLHKILDLLHKQNFEYAVSDFGYDTYARPRPPVTLRPETCYYRHIYACRMD